MQSDLIIVGGGLNGATLALAAAASGLTSTLVDALPNDVQLAPDFDGRSYALALTSRRMLERLGVWQGLAPDAQPITRIRVSDGRVGDASVFLGLDFHSAEIEDGPMGHMVEDRHLRRALLEALAGASQITHLAGRTVVAQETGVAGAQVTLACGMHLAGRVLIGADGRQSGTATRAGITRTGWQYRQSSLVCAIAHERPHDGVAHQLFLPPGPLAILPLTDRRSSIVWTETRARAEAFNALSDDDYLTILRPRFGDFLGRIELAGARYTYPLGLTLADALTGPRLALVGDAAHGVHPIAGQGLNAGLRDVAALADVLGAARRRGEDIGAAPVLGRYAEWRRFDTASLAFATDLFNRLFSNDLPFVRALRDLGMAAVNALPEVRRGVIREAAGLGGTLPALMR